MNSIDAEMSSFDGKSVDHFILHYPQRKDTKRKDQERERERERKRGREKERK